MRKILILISCAALSIFAMMCTSKKEAVHSRSSSEIVDSVANDYWQREQRTGRSISWSDPIFPDQLYKGTRQDFKDDSIYFLSILKKLNDLDKSGLSKERTIDYDLLEWLATLRLESTQFYNNTFPLITPYSYNLSGEELMFQHLRFSETEDLNHYLHLLDEFEAKLIANLEKLDYLAKLGIRLPKAEVELTVDFLKSYQSPASSLSFYVSTLRLEDIDSTLQKDFQAKVITAIDEKIKPGFDSLVTYLRGDYLKEAPDAVGLAQYPNGKEYYRYLVRWQTSTNLTPEEIHQKGQQKVRRISEEIDSIRKSTGFKGTRKEFYKFLQTDKRFLAVTPDEVGSKLKGHLSRMDKKISTLISIKPKAGYDVRRLALAAEPGMTFGYYSPPSNVDSLGIYYYNGSKLDQRSLISSASLAYHEIIPGHHWQISIQYENDSVSTMRRNFNSNAFAEGWGDYSAHLGTELGLYTDPYDYCGRLLMDMLISVRLVVDTGMNYLGWSREQAAAFMNESVIESEEQIKTEILRYSCDIQAQALGYKIGSLRLIELRKKYKNRLGDKFDVIKFHDTVLNCGSLPLDVLEKVLDREFGVN